MAVQTYRSAAMGEPMVWTGRIFVVVALRQYLQGASKLMRRTSQVGTIGALANMVPIASTFDRSA
jgi:hypothetical protein